MTYPSILGLEGAREYARRYTEEAVDALSIFAENNGILTEYVRRAAGPYQLTKEGIGLINDLLANTVLWIASPAGRRHRCSS